MAMVLLTAPLGLVGVVPTLLAFIPPFGFNAMLGLIGLAGILNGLDRTWGQRQEEQGGATQMVRIDRSRMTIPRLRERVEKQPYLGLTRHVID